MGDFRKKYREDRFGGKNSCKEIRGEKISYTEKIGV